jgi:hypothetical protein
VARSGYDTTHKCGFIAAESIASAEWHKRIVLSFNKEGKKFRAWARGEHPTLFQIRIYLPMKYNIISSINSTQILINYNPFLKSGTFELLREEPSGEGRALFFSVSREAFLQIRETYKLNFPLGKLDCNNATPKTLNPVTTRPINPTFTQIPLPPVKNQNQIDQAIQALSTPLPTSSTPLPTPPQNRTGIKAILPSTARAPSSSPPRPTYSPVSRKGSSTDSETTDDNSPQKVSMREALLETSGSSASSKGSHRSRTKHRHTSTKRKREKDNQSSSNSTNGHISKKH